MVSAHSGRLDKNGCHTCYSNCNQYGLRDGEYHCHRGSSSSSENIKKKTSNTSSNIAKKGTNNKKTSNNMVKVVKSNSNANKKSNNMVNSNANSSLNSNAVKNIDISLKSVTVNDDIVSVSDKMNYKTSKDSANVVAIANDSSVSVLYDKEIHLNYGSNNFFIKVVSKNSSDSKVYELNIDYLSDNTELKLSINDIDINPNSNETIKVDKNTSTINLKYAPVDSRSKVTMNGYNGNLSYGENIINFVVTADDGSKKKYKVIVDREYPLVLNIIYTILSILVFYSGFTFMVSIIVLIAMKVNKKI